MREKYLPLYLINMKKRAKKQPSDEKKLKIFFFSTYIDAKRGSFYYSADKNI